MTQVRGDRIILRGFRPHEIDLAMRQMARGPLDSELERRRRERLKRSGTRNDWEVLFGVEAAGRLVGDVQGRCVDFAMPPGVWEIGIELWDEADRGRGLGREAVALLAGYLFGEEAAIRVQATTDLDNVAMCRVLEALWFEREGVLRGFMPTANGRARDYAMYGITKDDWENVKGRWIRTS
ncbi:MAG TPA: GNAT family protein [Actinomycetota bacterium]|nr:GNAT family protein [Actinomycetota bacterium]